jgi:CheY-like chemotaxis protein
MRHIGRGDETPFLLPLRAQAAYAAPTQMGAFRVLDGLHVMVVDDNEDACAIMREALTHDGALVTVCGSADEAIHVLRYLRPHVLVADIAMPWLSGLDLIRTIRALPTDKGGAIPAVAVTAFGARFPRSVALSAGFQEYLPKPLDVWELSRLVATVGGLIR